MCAGAGVKHNVWESREESSRLTALSGFSSDKKEETKSFLFSIESPLSKKAINDLFTEGGRKDIESAM